MTSYGIDVTLEESYPDAVERTRAALAEQGFGVLTEIDVAATMKAKLDADVPPQVILGACNPPLAYRALGVEASIGVLLPCNVVVRALDDTHTLVEAIDPAVMVTATGNEQLAEVADEARARLENAIKALAA
ncbi:MAG TPA: DUF302 domain-containing protein [Jatrophihabitans sp.]|nr:DUF302 domain-containing protein [Jatrophihabitans sp.]